MKKLLKRVALISALMIAVVCMGLFAAACEDDSKAYSITVVYEDGTAVNGKTDGIDGKQITFQLCEVDDKGEIVQCLSTKAPVDENGNASLSTSTKGVDTTKTYHVQLNNIPKEYGSDEVDSLDPKVNMSKPGKVTITLKKVK